MKARALFVLALLTVLACSKSSDPAKTAAGCTVTFKGTAYTLSTVACTDAVAGSNADGLTAFDSQKALLLTRDLDDPASSSINFTTDTNNVDASYSVSVDASGSAPTITRSGKSWTFSGTAQNSDGDTGALSGSCTCTN